MQRWVAELYEHESPTTQQIFTVPVYRKLKFLLRMSKPRPKTHPHTFPHKTRCKFSKNL